MSKPVLLYDGRCGFCKIWVNYWRELTGDRIEYATSQDAGDQFPQIPKEDFSRSVQLVREDGSVASGARAVFESLQMLWLYRLIAWPSEAAYPFIARRRDLFYQVTRFTFGTRIEPARFQSVQWIFLRALGLIYVIAFASLATQVSGLLGSGGLLPVVDFLSAVQRAGGAIRFLAVPSIFWLGADDTTLEGLCYVGIVLGVLLVFTGFQRGRFERFILFLLYAIYLSFSSVGQDFLQFQWDSLLLEAGFLAIFLGSNRVTPWLFRWLVFRFYFLSGVVKILSGDRTWRNLSALDYHFHTQPLPNVVAWYADKLPAGFQHFATFLVLAVEIGVPFLVFFPRRIRQAGAWVMIGLQVLIFLTGNYTFFNLLTIAMCVFLFDDQAIEHSFLKTWIPERTRAKVLATRVERAIASALAVVIVGLGLAHFWETYRGTAPAPVAAALRYTAPLQIVNTYGLFAVMTTVRNEIVVEGSDDGQNWTPYEFRYKPGDLKSTPKWVEPMQPRLDWQMWFAALGNYQSNPWFVNMALRLLQGSPAVENLLASNPFPDRPPRFIRATVYEYTFSDFATRRATGAWWKREYRGGYLPAVGLKGAAQGGETGPPPGRN